MNHLHIYGSTWYNYYLERPRRKLGEVQGFYRKFLAAEIITLRLIRTRYLLCSFTIIPFRKRSWFQGETNFILFINQLPYLIVICR